MSGFIEHRSLGVYLTLVSMIKRINTGACLLLYGSGIVYF